MASDESQHVQADPIIPPLPPPQCPRTVLLAVDLSARSERLIHWYRSNAAYATDRVVLGHIIEPPSMLVGHFTLLATKEPEYYTIEGGQQAAMRLGERLSLYAETVGLAEVQFRGQFYGCGAPLGLLRLAEEVAASVIVVGGRLRRRLMSSKSAALFPAVSSRSAASPLRLGSTAGHVLRRSPRPVLVAGF